MMPAWKQIHGFLTPQSSMTTRDIATRVGESVRHVGRVLRWMEGEGFVRLIPGSNPFRWSA
jgi:hypothetical protein